MIDMTFYANRNNIEVIFRCIAVVMMPMLCLRRTIMALQGINTRQFIGCNSVIGLPMVWMDDIEMLIAFFLDIFAFFALPISFLVSFIYHLAFFALPPFLTCLTVYKFTSFSFLIVRYKNFLARFTISIKSIIFIPIFVKLRQRFELFALGASFCFNWFSHNVLSLQKNVLIRAGFWHIPAVGSIYNKVNITYSQY